mgnify:CR=1 FL=1
MRKLLSNTPTQPELSPSTIARPEAAADDWRSQAKCSTESCDPDMFFPNSREGTYVENAVKFCYDCPVKDKCLDYAIDNHEAYGVWGGTTPFVRDALSRTRQNRRARSRLRRNQ